MRQDSDLKSSKFYQLKLLAFPSTSEFTIADSPHSPISPRGQRVPFLDLDHHSRASCAKNLDQPGRKQPTVYKASVLGGRPSTISAPGIGLCRTSRAKSRSQVQQIRSDVEKKESAGWVYFNCFFVCTVISLDNERHARRKWIVVMDQQRMATRRSSDLRREGPKRRFNEDGARLAGQINC